MKQDSQTLPVFNWDDAKRRLRQLAETLDPTRVDSAAEQRAILDQRARDLAVPLDADADDSDSIEVLKIRMGGETYALETAIILELTRIATLTRVPDCPPFFRGITNLRGDVLAVIDLCTFFGVAGSTQELPWMLVLGDDRAEFGVVIDEADEVCSLDTREIFPASVSLPDTQRAVLRGVTAGAMLVLDSAALLADQRLFVDET